ncbi:hypothetical protein KQI74_23405 [Paenibacillus barcinonensis]|uniref:reverse transcriptase domain-containing protein n=1 Tax=Paenibacillus barcinonensis TaxID=198119 RepID=UPI001C0FEE8A|nr:reverse transcriptase domain-containing protein [Paenibacillus barcinonensis]MBU5355207.1 hypothetical protein [Paenibacillus barcinonensis]
MTKLRIEDIYDAYRKFKSYSYYDNQSYYLRKLIADFESSNDFEVRLNTLYEIILDYKTNNNTSRLEKYLNEISYNVMPKKFMGTQHDRKVINSSSVVQSSYEVISNTILIQAPIEVHLISVLWIMKVGMHSYITNNSYAYKLSLKDKKIKEGNKLFHPYYDQYKLWKDNALSTVKKLVDNKANAILVSLDIKHFYHSVDFSFNPLHKELGEKHKGEFYLSSLLEKIHLKYAESVNHDIKSPNKNILPIGLLSSGILANWYLKKFDQNLIDKLAPEYYGRYVDDILIVLNRNNKYINTLKNEGEQFLLLHDGIFIENNEMEGSYNIKDYPSLSVQNEKMKIFIFDRNTSAPLLSKIGKILRDNSSEFRLLPDESLLQSEINDLIFNVSFTNQDIKLRNISDVTVDKFEISKFFSQKILLSKYLDKHSGTFDDTTFSIIELFKGQLGLELFSLWEKVFTFLILLNQKDKLTELYRGIKYSIHKIKSNNEETTIQLKRTMLENLQTALATNLALNPSFLLDSQIKKIIDTKTLDLAWKFRITNMSRHHVLTFPLLNYSAFAFDEKYNLLENNIMSILIHQDINIDINSNLVKYSPRFIPFHEVSSYITYEHMIKPQNDNIIARTFEQFYNLNFHHRSYNNDEFKNKIKKTIIPPSTEEESEIESHLESNLKVTQIIAPSDEKKLDKLSVALANIKISHLDIENNLIGKTNNSHERLNNLFKILNMFSSEKCDMIVLPELSIPLNWFPLLVKYSMIVRKSIIFGMEHLVKDNTVYNYQITILPTNNNGFPSCIIKPRLKNHYSPEEIRIIKGYRLKVPRVDYSYDLFVWKGVHFSCFNCYELTDIAHRAFFKSRIDLLVVTEDNRDVNYFSNLAESISRDLHCFFVQVNNAHYGDSRITQPSKTETKNIVQLKGGENSTILIGELNINALRKFQIKEYELQKEERLFKPTPPDFNKDLVIKRLL